MTNEVQPTLYKKPKVEGARWTGRGRDPERFRARVLTALRRQSRYGKETCDPTWRQSAWEAWHIVKHLYAAEMYCQQCAPFIRTSLFPTPLEMAREARNDE